MINPQMLQMLMQLNNEKDEDKPGTGAGLQDMVAQISRMKQSEDYANGMATETVNAVGPAAGNPNVVGSIRGAAKDIVQEQDKALLGDPNSGIPGRPKWRDMDKSARMSYVMKSLANALAVYSSSNPGQALQSQIQSIIDDNNLISSRRDRSRGEAASREFSRQQAESESDAQDRRLSAELSFRSSESELNRQNDINNLVSRFEHDEAMQELQQIFNAEQASLDRSSREAMNAQDLAARQASLDATASRILVDTFGSNVLSFGINDTGVSDQMGRPKRLVKCLQNMDACSESDTAILHRALLEREGKQDEEAAQIAATRLVGKLMPVPLRDPQGNVVRNPVTNQIEYEKDKLGEILRIPMSYEEALTQVSIGQEDAEFVSNRIVDRTELAAVSSIMADLSRVDPSKISPDKLRDRDGQIGLLSALSEAFQVTTPEGVMKAFKQLEEMQVARGKGKFPSDTTKTLEKILKNETSKLVEKEMQEKYRLYNLSTDEIKLVRGQEALGKSVKQIRSILNSYRSE